VDKSNFKKPIICNFYTSFYIQFMCLLRMYTSKGLIYCFKMTWVISNNLHTHVCTYIEAQLWTFSMQNNQLTMLYIHTYVHTCIIKWSYLCAIT